MSNDPVSAPQGGEGNANDVHTLVAEARVAILEAVEQMSHGQLPWGAITRAETRCAAALTSLTRSASAASAATQSHDQVVAASTADADALTFDALQDANVARCNVWPGEANKLHAWSLTDWLCALAGEVGEAANIAKKLRRGDYTLDAARESLADEIADAVIYCGLIAARADFRLGEAVARKFNAVSERIGVPHRLRAASERVVSRDAIKNESESSGGVPASAEELIELAGHWTRLALSFAPNTEGANQLRAALTRASQPEQSSEIQKVNALRLEENAEYSRHLARLDAELAALRAERGRLQAVVDEACRVVDADTYKHPMLSRADAIAAGVAGLHDAVSAYRSHSVASASPVEGAPEKGS